MPNDDHPFDRALRETVQKEQRERLPMTEAHREQIQDAIRDRIQKKKSEEAQKERPQRPRFVFWFLGLGFAAFALLLSLPLGKPETWSGWEDAGGSKGTATNESALSVLMDKEWTVTPEFKSKKIQISLGSEATLRGELNPAPELNTLKLEDRQYFRLRALSNRDVGNFPITGSGILEIQSTAENKIPQRKTLNKATLKLELHARDIAETRIRKLEQTK